MKIAIAVVFFRWVAGFFEPFSACGWQCSRCGVFTVDRFIRSIIVRNFFGFLAIAVALGATLGVSTSTRAQDKPPAASSALPSDSELDAMLAARNWAALAAALSSPNDINALMQGMNWLRRKIDNGEGFLLTLIYSNDLWMFGNSAKIDDPNRDLRLMAGAMTLYAYQLIVIDGAKCEDRTAPIHHATQLLTQRAPMIALLKKQSPDVKARFVDASIGFEKRTASKRRDDDAICSGGIDAMQAGGSTKEVPSAQGVPGRTIAITPPANWVPKFVPPDVYTPVQEKMRAEMRGSLLKLVE